MYLFGAVCQSSTLLLIVFIFEKLVVRSFMAGSSNATQTLALADRGSVNVQTMLRMTTRSRQEGYQSDCTLF